MFWMLQIYFYLPFIHLSLDLFNLNLALSSLALFLGNWCNIAVPPAVFSRKKGKPLTCCHTRFHRNRQCLLVIADHVFAYQITFLVPLKVSLEYLPLCKCCPFDYFGYLYPKCLFRSCNLKRSSKKPQRSWMLPFLLISRVAMRLE